MTQQPTLTRPTSARRVGFMVAVLANAALLWLIHVWPGWDVMPFLMGETPQALRLVDAALVAGIVVNVVHLLRDSGWRGPAGDLVTTAFGLAATVRVLQVFPFDLGRGWTTATRVLLVVAIAGSIIGLVVAFVSLLRTIGVTRIGQ